MMKRRMFGVAVITAAAVLSLSPIPAKAAIFVGACVGAACVPVTIASNATNGLTPFSGSLANWQLSGSALLTSPPPVFSSNTLDLTSTGPFPSTLNIYVTGTGVDQAGILSILSGFQILQLPTGWTASESTFADINNGIYTTVTPLGTTGTVNGPVLANLQTTTATPFTGDNSFSVTERYIITATSLGTFQGDITLTASVPGPVAGAGLPGLVMACGGLIALARRRRKAAVSA